MKQGFYSNDFISLIEKFKEYFLMNLLDNQNNDMVQGFEDQMKDLMGITTDISNKDMIDYILNGKEFVSKDGEKCTVDAEFALAFF